MAGISGEADGPGGRAGVARENRGDAAVAVTDLFRDHHLELVRLALVMVGDLATAEDVVQDAFERLHRGWHGLRQPSSSLAYVRASVLNGCRSVHRRAAVARKHVPRLAEPSPDGPDAATAADDRGELAGALRQRRAFYRFARRGSSTGEAFGRPFRFRQPESFPGLRSGKRYFDQGGLVQAKQ